MTSPRSSKHMRRPRSPRRATQPASRHQARRRRQLQGGARNGVLARYMPNTNSFRPCQHKAGSQLPYSPQLVPDQRSRERRIFMPRFMLAATAVAMLLTLDPMVAMAQSMCDAILRYGTFDQEGSFTSRQRFELVKNAFCKSTVSTLTSAKDVGVNLGVDVVGVVEAALGVSTSEANFQTNKDAFCALDYSKVQDNFTSETKIKRASEVIAKAWTTCVTQATGFVAWIVDHPQKTGFTINMQNNSAGSSQFDITALNFVPATGVTCSRKEQDATPARPIKILTRTATIGCTKPADQTIQVSMNTSVGTMPVVTVEGTTATLEDLRKRLAAIETFGANFPRGTIIAWFASSGAVPNGWAVCDGSN